MSSFFVSTYKEYIPQTGFLSSIETVNEQGEVVQDMSFAFDQIGNLIRRTDYVMNNGGPQRQVNEWFWYDNLNRLTETHSDGHNNSGNIESVASYGYDETGNLKFKHRTTLTYEHPTKPHAVTIAQGGGPTKKYFYDDNGNVTHIKNNSNQVVSNFEYSSFDKAELMQANDWSARVYYDAGRSRYIRKDYQGMGPIVQSDSDMKTTHYVDGVEYIYQGGSYQVKRYLGNVVIESTELNKYRNQWKYSYLLKDHLGSIHTVVNRQGQHNGRFSFNEWGERRRALMPTEDDIYQEYTIAGVWSALGEQIEDTTNRGFTGHEHFDQVGIIHMNGRIYDATIGRFLQADPIIQDPYNTQSLNRYSYVMNNPLSYTDPSGYSRLRKGWWRMPVAIAISIYTGGAASSLMASAASATTAAASSAFVVQAITVSVAGGFAAGAVATGTLKGAVKGGIMAAVTFGIGHGFDGTGGVGAVGSADRIIAHSLVSGVSAEIDGGQFGHGFASAALSQAIGKGAIFNHEEVGLTAIVTNALLQGSISELTGGKFANGAISAAFRVAFNHALEGARRPHGHNGEMHDNKGNPYPGRGSSYSPITGEWMDSDDAAATSVMGERTQKASPFVVDLSGGGEAGIIVHAGVGWAVAGSCSFRTECLGVGPGWGVGVSPSVSISQNEFDTSPYINLPWETKIDEFYAVFGTFKVFGFNFGGEITTQSSIEFPINKFNKSFGTGAKAGVKMCSVYFEGCF